MLIVERSSLLYLSLRCNGDTGRCGVDGGGDTVGDRFSPHWTEQPSQREVDKRAGQASPAVLLTLPCSQLLRYRMYFFQRTPEEQSLPGFCFLASSSTGGNIFQGPNTVLAGAKTRHTAAQKLGEGVAEVPASCKG